MNYLRFLSALHERLRPETYLEIGVATGESLALARTVAIGIDPAPAVTRPFGAGVHLVRASSDEAFASTDLLAPFRGRSLDLAYIDGLHRFEYVLRDFRYIEAHCERAGVVVVDDVLPRSAIEASRTRFTRAWAGDVWKIVPTLAAERPDLLALVVDTDPTGTLVVFLPDRENRVLHDRYEAILERMVERDPQIPSAILAREHAMEPEALLASPLWEHVRHARRRRDDAGGAADDLGERLRTAVGTIPRRGSARSGNPSRTC